MPDNLSVLPAGAAGNALRPVVQKTQPVIQPVQAGGTSAATNKHSNQTNAHSARVPQPELARKDPLADDRLTGPPPAFQASVLEVEADLETTIRRIEAAREKARNESAVAAEREVKPPDLDTEKEARKAMGLDGPPTTTELIAERIGQSSILRES